MRTRTKLIVSIFATAAMAGCGSQGAPYLDVLAAEPADKAAAGAETLAEFNRALGLAADGRYAEADGIFEDVARRFDAVGDRAAAAEATFWVAYCREKQRRFAEASSVYRRVIGSYPRQPAADQARRRLSRIQGAPRGE